MARSAHPLITRIKITPHFTPPRSTEAGLTSPLRAGASLRAGAPGLEAEPEARVQGEEKDIAATSSLLPAP